MPASPSYLASRNTRTHKHTLSSCKQYKQCRPTVCTQGIKFRSRISLPLFDRKPSKSAATQRHQNSNFSLPSFPPHTFFDPIFFAKTCPERTNYNNKNDTPRLKRGGVSIIPKRRSGVSSQQCVHSTRGSFIFPNRGLLLQRPVFSLHENGFCTARPPNLQPRSETRRV